MAGVFNYPIGDIHLEYTIIANWDASVLLSALTNVLQSSPLKLQVDTSSPWVDVTGVESHRVSPYLAPYREIVQISAMVREDGDDKKKRFVQMIIELILHGYDRVIGSKAVG